MSRWLGWYRSPMANAIPAATCSIRQTRISGGAPAAPAACRQPSKSASMTIMEMQHLQHRTHLAAHSTDHKAHPSNDQQQPINSPPPQRACKVRKCKITQWAASGICRGISMLMCILDNVLCAVAAQPHVCSQRTSGDYAHGLHPRLLQVCQAHAQRRRPWMVLCTPHSQQPLEASSIGR